MLYSLSTSPELDIGAAFRETAFRIPPGIRSPTALSEETVIRVVGGRLDAKSCRTLASTGSGIMKPVQMLTNGIVLTLISAIKLQAGKADEAKLGFYIVIRDGGDIMPSPQTGDNTMIGAYVVLLIISGGMCLFLCHYPKRREKVEN